MGAMMIIYCMVLLISSAMVNAQCPSSTATPVTLKDFVKHQEVFNPGLEFKGSCTWRFTGNYPIIFQVTNLLMDPPDTLEVFDGPNKIDMVKNEDARNAARAIGVTTNTSWIVKFTGGHETRANEPRFTLNAISAKDNSMTGNKSPGGVINLTATSQRKYLTSPLFPNKYASNAKWTWNIIGANSLSVKLTIDFLDMEGYKDGKCQYDRLEINKDLGGQCKRTQQCKNENAVCSAGTCQCKSGYIRNGDVCEANLGKTCSGSEQCKDDNAVCDGTCQCKSGYFQSGDVCKALLGGKCNSDKECTDDNAVCAETCQCKSGYVQNGDVCKAPSSSNIALGGKCNNDDECNDGNAVCADTCQCKSGYIQNEDVCEISAECSEDPNTIYCPETDLCYCKPGFIKVDGSCIEWQKCTKHCFKRKRKCSWRTIHVKSKHIIIHQDCLSSKKNRSKRLQNWRRWFGHKGHCETDCPSLHKYCCSTERESCRCAEGYNAQPDGSCAEESRAVVFIKSWRSGSGLMSLVTVLKTAIVLHLVLTLIFFTVIT